MNPSVAAAVCLDAADVLERLQNPAGMRHDPVEGIWLFTSSGHSPCPNWAVTVVSAVMIVAP